MNPLSFCLLAFACALAAGAGCQALEEAPAAAAANARDLQEEMQLINKSLEGLLAELATIKRAATGRLSQERGKPAEGQADRQRQAERIRQTKVSRFVLKRVAELELESMGMRDEMERLFELQRKTLAGESQALLAARSGAPAGRQEDFDFDAPAASPAAPAASTATATTTTTALTPSEAEEAKQIGFDLEQLKRLGGELEAELEARQAQGAESVRGVHEQLIKLVDNMVNNYLGNMRRAVQRFTNFIDNRRAPASAASQQQPRRAPSDGQAPAAAVDAGSVLGQLEALSKRFREFTMQWSKALGRQQSPLIDRIPPRGVELWRDFWDTVRKQVRRINEEFWQLSRDMGRVLTGRPPSTGSRVVIRPREGEGEGAASGVEGAGSARVASLGELLYSSASAGEQAARDRQNQEQIRQQFEEFYEKLTVQLAREQQKMNELSRTGGQQQPKEQLKELDQNALLDELDDEVTKQELAHNIALRQQIQQEINVFGSIFDIMRAFIARLRDSATTIRDILTPPGAPNDNNSVTPGPAVKPTVDKLLEDTINSQRNINSQARPTSRD